MPVYRKHLALCCAGWRIPIAAEGLAPKPSRGLHDDPIVFALRDKSSLLIGAIIALSHRLMSVLGRLRQPLRIEGAKIGPPQTPTASIETLAKRLFIMLILQSIEALPCATMERRDDAAALESSLIENIAGLEPGGSGRSSVLIKGVRRRCACSRPPVTLTPRAGGGRPGTRTSATLTVFWRRNVALQHECHVDGVSVGCAPGRAAHLTAGQKLSS